MFIKVHLLPTTEGYVNINNIVLVKKTSNGACFLITSDGKEFQIRDEYDEIIKTLMHLQTK